MITLQAKQRDDHLQQMQSESSRMKLLEFPLTRASFVYDHSYQFIDESTKQ
jgi:hypothetical protein